MKKRFTNSGTSTTKNETSTRKLKLARETLRSLNAPDLARVGGGNVPGADTYYTCTEPECRSTI